MTSTPSTIHDLARALAGAHEAKATISAPVAALGLSDGYAVQAEVARLRGAPVAGYKIGLTNPAAQRAMGVTEPIVGRLRAADILRGEAAVPGSACPRFAEAELVVQIGEDLPPSAAPFDQATVARAVTGVYAGIELCSSRYADDEPDAGALVADNSNAELLVVGDRLSTMWEDRFATLEATLLRSSSAPVHGGAAAVLGNPLAALTWLANWLAARGEMLCRGQLVATGSCTGITAIASDEWLTSRFSDGSEAHARIGHPADRRERI